VRIRIRVRKFMVDSVIPHPFVDMILRNIIKTYFELFDDISLDENGSLLIQYFLNVFVLLLLLLLLKYKLRDKTFTYYKTNIFCT